MDSPLASVPHPRLFVPRTGFDTLRQLARLDPRAHRIADCLRRKADSFCARPPNRRVLVGRRLLAVSRSCLERVLTLAMAARLEGNERYLRRAADEMLAAAAFEDWNPSHFLDVAEMTFGLATGCDWLRDLLPAAEAETIAAAIVEKGLRPSLREGDPGMWWIAGANNWNQVCHAGMAVGALAVAERESALAEQIVARAVANVPRIDAEYQPDGAYAEGPMYWTYGTSFHVALISALETATGSDHGLADGPGFLASAHYLRQVEGPAGRYFNYSDCHEAGLWQVSMLWFARRLREPALAQADPLSLDRSLAKYEVAKSGDNYRFLALGLGWCAPAGAAPDAGTTASPGLPRSWRGRGRTPVALHRSVWDDPLATFVGIKGGSPSSSHAHMDAGSFVLDAGGVRWAADLGMQEYESLERLHVPLWDGKQDGGRWTVFRLSTHGHNVPSFNGAQQLVHGNAAIVRFEGGDRAALRHAVVDLSTNYADHVVRLWRGAGLLADGRVILQDEWTAGSLAVDVRWQMLTFAQVAVDARGRRFLLSHEDKQLELRLDPETGANVKLSVEERSRPVSPYDTPNPGLSVLVLTVHTEPGQTGTVRLVAALSEVAGNAVPPRQPLEQWPVGG